MRLSQKIDYNCLNQVKRDHYKIWIYFKDKNGSELINLTEETKQRRQKHAPKLIIHKRILKYLQIISEQ